jgi:hypothetical protein
MGFSLWQVMAQWWQILLGLWAVLPTLAGDKLLSVCMNSKRHKQEPGPEDELYQEVQSSAGPGARAAS